MELQDVFIIMVGDETGRTFQISDKDRELQDVLDIIVGDGTGRTFSI